MIRLAFRVARADAEIVLAELLELAPAGVEEVDLGGELEYAVYGAPGELPALPALAARAGGRQITVSSSEVADDWSERWREHHRPLILDGLVVRPPWLAREPVAGEAEVIIDPGQAFGTGAHATTRLCLELVLELAHRPAAPTGPLLDLGCGSGVLGIAAAKLGLGPVLAVDHDVLSVEATRINAAVNGVPLEALRLDLRTDRLPARPLVLGNLLRPLLLAYADRMPAPAPAVLIASGLLVTEGEEVAAAFGRHGLAERERRERDGWLALRLEGAD